MAKFIGDSEEVRKLSNDIRRIYNEAEDTSKDILSIVRELPNGWEGEASVAYQNQFMALNVLITNAIDGFENICVALDKIADTLEEDR